MRKAEAVADTAAKLGKRPFPIKRVIFGGVVLAIAVVFVVFLIKNAGAGLSEVTVPVGANTQNAVMSKPEYGAPDDYSATENLFIAAGVLKNAGSFSAECSGTSTSMGVSQGIRSSRTVIGEKAFKEVVSYSAFVKMGEQRYYNGSDYLIRAGESVGSLIDVSWSNFVTPIDKDTYLGRYGYIPCEMTSYILNEESIETGELVSSEGGLYTFRYDLDIALAPVNLLYEMRTSAGTNNYPKFLSADMTVVMDGNWTVQSVSTAAKYEVAMLGGVTCEESMTETFTQIGGISKLPETDFFAPYFGSETTDEIGKKPDALTALTEIFGDYINGKPLNVELTLSAPGTPLDNASALLRLGIDIENTENITVDARLGELDFAYRAGALYLAYGDFRGSMTTDGLTSALGSVCALLGVDPSASLGELDPGALLGGLTMTETDGGCVVALAADIGRMTIDAAINAEKNGDTYALTDIVVKLGDFALTARPCGAWDVKTFPEDCPDLLGLLDIIAGGTLAFTADINGLPVDLQYDLQNNVLNVFAGGAVIALQDETIYVEYNDIKLKMKLAELPGMADDLAPVLSALGFDFDFSSLGSFDAADIFDGLTVVADGDNAAFRLNIYGADICVDLAVIEGRWTLSGIGAAIGNVAIDAHPVTAKPFLTVDDSEFIDCARLLHRFAAPIAQLIAAENYAFDLNLDVSSGGTVYNLRASVNINGGISARGNIGIDGVNAAAFDVIYTDGVVYLSVNGLDFAFRAGDIGSGGTTDVKALLGSLRGYNGTLDAVIGDLLRVIGAAEDGIDFSSLLKSPKFDEATGAFVVTLGGEQFGLGDFAVTLAADSGLRLGLTDVVFGGIGIAADLCISASTVPVTAPERPYVTDLAIRIDALNTLYIRLDTLGGVYGFRLDDLYGEYANGTFRVNYRDVFLRGNIKELSAIIAALDDIVKDAQTKYAAGLISDTVRESVQSGDFVRTLLNSLVISANGEKGTLKIAFSIFGIPADITVSGGDVPEMTVNIALAGKDVTASVAIGEITYFDFDGVNDARYVDITQVFDDYFGEFETLAQANSWHFDVTAKIAFGDAKYLLAEGSCLDLVFYTSEKFSLKATLRLQKWEGAGYADAYNIVAAYVDGRIYIDYANAGNNGDVKADNHLKLTLDAAVIDKCADLLPRLLEVVPQLGQLIDEMRQSQRDALENLELVKYSSLIKAASYEDGTLGLVINAGVILPALGDIDLAVSRGESGGLRLGIGSLTYDDGQETTLSLADVAVSVAAQSADDGISNIGEFSPDGYFVLDSLYELVSAFTNTANSNAFMLGGTAKVSLAGITVDIGLDLVVDIDADGYVYISFRLYREKLGSLDIAGAAFNDYGGYSYLNYNGKTNTFRILRNSYEKYTYCSKCGTYDQCSKIGHLFNRSGQILLNTERGFAPEYDSGEISTAQFSAGTIDYLLAMVNFKGWITDLITSKLTGSDSNAALYGIEDIIKSYNYTTGDFNVGLDLTPIDGNLGRLTLDIFHDETLHLTKLTASMSLLSDWCTITLNELNLLTPESGLAVSRVTDNNIW